MRKVGWRRSPRRPEWLLLSPAQQKLTTSDPRFRHIHGLSGWSSLPLGESHTLSRKRMPSLKEKDRKRDSNDQWWVSTVTADIILGAPLVFATVGRSSPSVQASPTWVFRGWCWLGQLPASGQPSTSAVAVDIWKPTGRWGFPKGTPFSCVHCWDRDSKSDPSPNPNHKEGRLTVTLLFFDSQTAAAGSKDDPSAALVGGIPSVLTVT